MEKKRLTAMKAKINDVSTGKYYPQPGFEPNYVLTREGMRLSRVRIMGTIVNRFVSENGKFASITLDDSTSTIRAKAFNGISAVEAANVGDVVDLIGKVKEYQGEVYIVPEVLTKIEDPNWEILRELELKMLYKRWDKVKEIVKEVKSQVSDITEMKKVLFERYNIDNADVEAILQAEEFSDEPEKASVKEKVLAVITELDAGSGCDYTELLEKSGFSEEVIDPIINSFLTDGICFEPRPGRIKKL